MLMIKESCNLIGQEHILVNHSKVYAVYDKKKLSLLRIQIIFLSDLLLLEPNHPQTNQIYPS